MTTPNANTTVRSYPQTNIKIHPALRERVAASAKANQRSLNQEYARLLEQALDNTLAGYERGFNDGMRTARGN